jgi:hypothetical protein
LESPRKRRCGRTPWTQTNHVAVTNEKTRDSAAESLRILLGEPIVSIVDQISIVWVNYDTMEDADGIDNRQ